MMYVGFDIGETTGFTILDAEGEILVLQDLLPDQLNASTTLQRIANIPESYTVALELPAATHGGYRKIMREVVLFFMTTFPQAVRVQPGTWKQSAPGMQDTPYFWQGVPLSQHQRDAIGIARWIRVQDILSIEEDPKEVA